jgi:hypothetical protein
MSVTVNVVGQTAVSISVANQSAASVSVAASTGASVVASGGIGPAGFITVPGTATQAFGTFQLQAGDGITVSTANGQFLISSYPSTAVSSLAPVQSVAGRTGTIVLQASDVTAGTFAIGRIPTIGYTALSGVPTAFTPASHTHDAADVSSGTLSVARIPTISYTALSNTPTTFSPSAHTHSAADVTGLAAVATSGSYTSLQNIPSTFAPQAHTHSTADITGFTGTFAAGNHTHDAAAITSGVLDLARIPTIGYTALSGVPATFAPQAHTHSTADVVGLTASFSQVGHSHDYVRILNGLTGTVTIAGGAGVTVSTASSSITISAGGGGGGSFTGTVDGGTYTGTIAYDNTITITQQPTNQTTASGAATFRVVAVSSPGGRVRYQWQRQVAGTWTAVAGGNSTALALTGLTQATDNAALYRVVLSSQSAASVTSSEVTLGVDPLVPGAPTNVAGYSGDSLIRVTWDAPASNGGSPITDYVVQYSLSSSGGWTTYNDGTSTGTQIFIEGIAVGSYYLRVAAVNAIGQGPWSSTVGPVDNAPNPLAGSTTGASLGASWSGTGEQGTDLSLPSTYFSSSSGGPAARITSRYSGRVYFSWTSTGSNSRNVEIFRNDGAGLDNRKSGSNYVDVSTNEVVTIYFYPADPADRISITAYLVQ